MNQARTLDRVASAPEAALASRSDASSASDWLDLAGRILIVALFLPAGINKITGFDGTVGYIASAGLPLPLLGALLAIVVEVGGGIALLLGYRTRLATLVLAAFTVVASLTFHKFWAVPADQAMVQNLLFFKNIAVAGGLLVVASNVTARFRLDSPRRGKATN